MLSTHNIARCIYITDAQSRTASVSAPHRHEGLWATFPVGESLSLLTRCPGLAHYIASHDKISTKGIV